MIDLFNKLETDCLLMDKVRVAIIGLGGVAQIVHLPNLSKIKNVEIKSVAEVKKSRLNAVADKFNIKERYTDYHELLEKSSIKTFSISGAKRPKWSRILKI